MGLLRPVVGYSFDPWIANTWQFAANTNMVSIAKNFLESFYVGNKRGVSK